MAAPLLDVSNMSTDKKYRIEVTVVTGLEEVAKEEAEEKLGATVDTKIGRIGVDLPLEDVRKVLDLGLANHCMVVMSHIPDFQFSDNEHDNLKRIRNLAGDLDWPTGLKVWSQFFSFEHPIQDIPDQVPTDYGEVTILGNLTKSTESRAQKIKKKMKKRKGKFKRNAGSSQSGQEQESMDVITEKKDGEAVTDNQESVNNCGADKQIKSESIKACEESDTNSSAIDEALTDQTDKMANAANSNQIEKQEIDKPEDSEESQAKKQRTRKNPWNPLMPSFRVTCNRSGEGHQFNSMNVAANLGGGIYNYFGWNVKMTEMDIEVIINIVNQEVTLGIGLTREALHKGNIKEFGTTTLRPSICHGLLRLCNIQPGDVVCDPMCGVGSISIQGGLHWPNSFHLGADIIGNATKRGRANFDFVNEERVKDNKFDLPTDLVRWDTCCMPLRNQSVDVFVSDVPFGIRMGRKRDNWKLYNESLTEMARCSKPSQSRACLLTEDKNCMIKTLQKVSKYWTRVKTLTINVGGLSAGVYLLHRSAAKFECTAANDKNS